MTIHSPLTIAANDGVLLHEKTKHLPNLPIARFTRSPDRRVLYAFACGYPSRDNPGKVQISRDEGANWSDAGPLYSEGVKLHPTDSGAFHCCSDGTLVLAFSNAAESKWYWDPELNDAPSARLPLYATRSLDGGMTWESPQKLHDDWTGSSRDIVELKEGRLVFTTQKLLHHPGRHAVMTYASDDRGQTWQASNLVDLGGVGHHGGICEASLVELKDGRLLKYIRNGWGRLWCAYSTDRGTSWHPYGPTSVDATTAPPILLRLSSGLVVMVWNRHYPEGQTDIALERGELSISFSEDECQSWTDPQVIARSPKGEISYPQLFEFQPGVLWLTVPRGRLAMELREADFA